MNRRSSRVRALCMGSLLALGCGLVSLSHAQQDGAGASALQTPSLGEREFHEHAFREEDNQAPRFFDSRHHHDHYYPPIGSVFGELPPVYNIIRDPDGNLYLADGAWYRERSPGRYVVVSPEIGTGVPALPIHCTTVVLSGVPYYYANNTYYLRSPSGYLVVDPADR